MATIPAANGVMFADARFIRTIVGLMVFVLVAGFSVQLVMGRSSFSAPLIVHIHALVFFGWAFLFVAQSWLATRGPIALHRRLGWIGAGWIAVLLVMGIAVTVARVRQGTTPFFFQPQHFLIANHLALFVFAGLAVTAIRMRRATDWHWRLQVGGLATLLGPGFGRLLPMPFLTPFAFETAALIGAAFPIAGMIRDWRRDRTIHRAWFWAFGSIVVALGVARVIAHSPLGAVIYAFATDGAAGAAVPGLAYPLPPVRT